MEKINVSVIGASGYVGGELLRLLLKHPNVNLKQATSESNAGQFIKSIHPNLRQFSNKFVALKDLEQCDVLFLCLPHGIGMNQIDDFLPKAKTIIDLSGDFRLNDPKDYPIWYKLDHPKPELLKSKVLGLPELHKDKIKSGNLIACPGCMSTATILSLYPLIKAGVLTDAPIITEAKTGSSASGNKPTKAGMHAERSGVMRSFAPTSHRHSAEIIQELTIDGKVPQINFSATSVEAVRGILATSHVFLKDGITEIDIWGIYREFAQDKPFIRIVKEKKGNYRYPEPKLLIGTNVCEIGFEKDPHSNRLVVLSAIDNLMKGAAGQAVQCFNIAQGLDENVGLETIGLYPI
ncbi:MAG TPA: N-acetyl-gamma-glutamyl-phosphate reductase [Candidatus Saccharimonadales bacterium]|nr:N-acetyl-gamma-glutamyl-phosphate reductase [Candidatus Saccharimonadales bacterium]